MRSPEPPRDDAHGSPRPPPRAATIRRAPRPAAHSVVPLLLSVWLAVPAGAGAAEAPPSHPRTAPLWPLRPVHVDRSKETRERIGAEDRPAPAPRIVFHGDGRLRDDVFVVSPTRRVRLHGIRPVPADRLCTTVEGRRWACGLRARAVLSALVFGRTLVCRPIGDPSATPPTVDCTVDGASLSRTLVAGGWCDLDADGAADPLLAAALDRAKRGGLGLWSTAGPP